MDLIQKSRILSRILLGVGLWPRPADPSKHSCVNLFWRAYPFLLQIPSTFAITLFMWLDAVNSRDLEHTADVLYIALTESVLLIKIVNYWRYGQKLAQILRDWETQPSLALRTTAERIMWQKSQRVFGIISFIYIGCSLSVVFYKTLFAGIVHEQPFLFWVPFDRQRYFWIIYSYTLFTLPLTCITNITLDMLQCYMLLHVALIYRIIGMRLERLGVGHAVDGQSCCSNRKFFDEFVEIIKLHQMAKRYAKRCERIVCYPILSQITISAFVLCLSVYRLKQLDIIDNFMYFISMFQYAGVMILEIFLPCYYANEITVTSQELSMRLYSCDWIHLSPSNRKFILQFLVYLKKPIKIHAGPFFEISLQVFSKTMNNAYSLLALLLNMDE